jgi:uncharacterized protein (TIGR00297 family)
MQCVNMPWQGAAAAPGAATAASRRPGAPRRPPPPARAASAADGAAAAASPPPPPSPNLDPRVAKALAMVGDAMRDAEATAERLHELPSARLPTPWGAAARALRPAAAAAAVVAYCALVHSFHATAQVLGGLLLALAVAARGWSRSALSASGAAAAVVVGWATLGASFRAGLVLLAFFVSSSKLTQLMDFEKAVDEAHRPGGQRDWVQVVVNGGAPAALALAAAFLTGGVDAPLRPAAAPAAAALHAAFLGYYAACCGDTWASEVGQLSPAEPRLVTTLRPVRRGTNGGVTLLGLGASAAGGLLVGGVFYAAGCWSAGAGAAAQWALVPLGAAAGLVGSLIDSVLGATVQFTGFNRATGKVTSRRGEGVSPIAGLPLLDNNGVNLVAAAATAALTAVAARAIF